MPKYLVFVEAKAQKQYRKILKADQERVLDALQKLENAGLAARLDLKKLKGLQSHYRMRVGNFRIRFELTKDQTFVVYSISHREKAYE